MNIKHQNTTAKPSSVQIQNKVSMWTVLILYLGMCPPSENQPKSQKGENNMTFALKDLRRAFKSTLEIKVTF